MKIVDPAAPPAEMPSNEPERTAQVLRFRGLTKRDIPVEQVLEAAARTELRCVVVMGYGPDGEEYFASSMPDGADVIWLAERLKLQLLRTIDA